VSLQQLYQTLSSINTDGKTGKIYIYVRENGSKRVGMVQIATGAILSVSYSGKTGEAAIEKLLSLGIEEVIFMPRSDMDGNHREADAPSISNLLTKLHRQLIAGDAIENIDLRRELFQQELRQEFGQQLRQEVESLLKKIYGPGIVNEMNKIAKSHPPDQNPGEFLNQCKAKAMLMLSQDQVEKMFGPLYKKIT
jgi:hypothetical protein